MSSFTAEKPAPTSNGGPPAPHHPTDQEEFDAAVTRNARIGVQALAAVAVAAALAMSAAALVISTQQTHAVTGVPAMAASPMVAASPTVGVMPLYVSVAGSNKLGPDGKMHDSFSQTNFAVKVGQPTLVRINNTDAGSHSITSAATGVSITVLPGVHTYAMTATRAGRFEWVCVIPCDSDAKGWAMTHPGYMAGYITVT